MTPQRTPNPAAARRRSRRAGDADPTGLFRQAVLLAVLVAAAAVAAPLRAQDGTPERERPPAAPQAVGALHTVRSIPEACTRLEGVFTGEAAQPYRLQAVPTFPGCQPRARYVEPAAAQPSVAGGWILNNLIRIPDAACPSRQAVVRVWRKPVDQSLQRDGQGQVRIYLQDARKQASAGQMRALPQFSAAMSIEGGACDG